MKKCVSPSAVNGQLKAPPSKSAAQRAIAIAALADGVSEISKPGRCDDVLAAINVCCKLGAKITKIADKLVIEGTGRKNTPESDETVTLDCGESGLGIRMFSGIAAARGRKYLLTGRGSLLKRPMHSIEASLRALGVDCSTENGHLPLYVKGPFNTGHASIDASLSSQVLTGILIGAPLSESNIYLHVDSLKSKPYIDLTLKVMKAFGVELFNSGYTRIHIPAPLNYHACSYVVEGDWSGAAFLLVAGATSGQIAVSGLKPSSAQADKRILEALDAAGAQVSVRENEISVRKHKLMAFEFDATHCPDLFPPLAVLAANCKGESRIFGAGRLRAKESDRAMSISDILGKMGISVRVEDDTMIIKGGSIRPATVSSHSDHRIAMAAAVAGLNAEGEVCIEGAQAINKSYPDFFDDLDKTRQ